ncbi:hypothetical protein BXZ70DRAFT_1006069 [Cristinia sonorae]|uniref:Uncharacterized protein n=1 Tax=Cristinia sonorae TaxID=1940300 RepID=A0A8K0XRS0_9AGAR|nr:hypothetical protein BXZ70DRAFT_1006069 [Cristinia sonorae]
MNLIWFYEKKDSVLFAGFVQLLSHLYANCLLGSLNMRSFLRNQSQPEDITSPTEGVLHDTAIFFDFPQSPTSDPLRPGYDLSPIAQMPLKRMNSVSKNIGDL